MASKFGRIADWFIPGNAYNSTLGRWNPATTKTGIAGLVADQFVPGGSQAISGLVGAGAFGQDFKGQLQREGNTSDITDSFDPFARQLQRDNLHPGVEVGDIGDAPRFGGQLQTGGQLSSMVGQPYQFGQQPQATTSGLPNTQTSYGVSLPNYGAGAIGRPPMGGVSNYGPYQGGYQFPQAVSQPTVSGLPNTQTSYGVSLPNYGQMPTQRGAGGNGAGAGTGVGAMQITGEAAADWMNNAKYGSSPNSRATGADTRGFKLQN